MYYWNKTTAYNLVLAAGSPGHLCLLLQGHCRDSLIRVKFTTVDHRLTVINQL